MPSDDISALMKDAFSKEFREQQQARDAATAAAARERATRIAEPGVTRTVVLRQKGPEPAPQPLFKLPRFAGVPAATQSFRSAEQRELALHAHQLEGIPRLGITGQGAVALHTK